MLLLSVLVFLPTSESTFVANGTIFGVTTMGGWSQTGVYSVTDGSDTGDTLSGEHNNVLKLYTSIGTTLGGNSEPTLSNQIQNYYFRIDTNRADGSQFGKWNIQLNLGSTTQGKADYLLQFQVPTGTLSGVTFGTEGNIRLEQYTTSGGSGVSAPVSLAVTTGALTNRVTSSLANGGSGRWSLAVDNSNKQSIELAIPASWFLSTSAPGSTVKSDGTGNVTLSGAMFSSTGTLGAVGTVKDLLRDPSGNAVITTTNLRTGTTTFQNNQASQTNFGQQPTNVDVNTAISPAVTVRIEDSLGNVVTGATHEVTMAIGTNPGSGTLSGTLTVAAVSGVATFSDLAISAAGTGYTLVATVTGVGSKTSSAFNVVVPSQTVTISASDASASEAGPDTGAFTVTRSGSTASALTVLYSVSGTASSGPDFTALSGSLTINSGSSTGTLTVTPVDDAIDELDETVIVTISTDAAYSVGSPSSATVTIADNDAPPTVALSLNGSPVAEAAGSATVTGTLSAASGRDVRVNLTFSGNATLTSDYTRGAASFAIGAGSTTGSVTLTAVQDATDEWDEAIVVDVASVWNATESGTQQVTAVIADDDAQPSVTLSLTGSPMAEAAGAATVTATLSAASGKTVTVDLAFSANATLTSDYTRSATSITVNPGATTGSITLTAVQDAADEPDEGITVDISTVTNAAESGTQQVTATITDDDAQPTVSLSVSGSPAAENGGVATVTATLSAVSGLTVTVNLGFTGNATLASDYTRSGTSITIGPGSTTGSITLTAAQDALDEENENIVIDVTSVTNAAEAGTQQVMATITDDDAAPSVTLSITGSPMAEAAGAATVTATLATPSGKTVTVNLAFGGNATLTSDYTRSGTSITISPGATTGSITLTAVQDAADEPDEGITVDIGSVANGTESGVQQVTATIADDDNQPTVTLSLTGSPITENAGVATVTATLNGASGRDVTVVLSFGGNATLTNDYTRSGTSILIAAGATTGSITITGVHDALDEENEAIVVDITTVANATEAGTQQVTATIADDDAPPTVTLSLTGSPMGEAAGVATITATLSGASGKPVTVVLGFSGTATITSDYVRSGTSVAIVAGTTTGTITLTAVQDAIDELSETVTVDVSSVTNGTELSAQQVTATISDDDATPTVTLTVSGSPMAENAGVATITATLSAASGLAVLVGLAFGGNASHPSDYTRSGTSISISPGATTGSITLTAVQDALAEANEAVVVDVDSVANATESGTQQATALIADDEGVPSVTLGVSGSPIAEAGGVATVTATLSGTASVDVTVNLGFAGNATLASDYTRSGTSMVIPAGSLTGSITLTAVQDAVDEENQSVVVSITSVLNANELGSQQVAATITDDDAAPTITLSMSGSPIAENGGTATVTATLSGASEKTISISLLFGGNATLTADYTRSNTLISIAPGNTTGSVTVTGVADAIDEANETIVIDAGTATNASEATPQQVTIVITDANGTPTVTLSAVGSTVAEAGASKTVTATLSGASSQDVTVNLVFGGTATLSTDYTRSAASITIPAGSTSASITLTAVQDAIDETDETVIIDVSSVLHATESGSQQVIVSITDDDAAPTVTIAASATSVVEGSGTVTVWANLSAASGLAVTVTFGFGGSANGTTDYTKSASSLVIAAGSTSGSITLTPTDDSTDEPTETVVLDVTGVANGNEDGSQQVTLSIADNDPPSLTVTASDASASEQGPGTGTFTVARTVGDVSGALVVRYTLSGTATNGTDFTGLGGTVTIAAGNTSANITVAPVDDLSIEGAETVVLTISADAAYAVGSPSNATISIADNDSPGITVTPTSGLSVAEVGTTATFTVVLNTVPVANVYVLVSSSDTTEGTVSTTNLTFTPANALTPQTVTITGVNDFLIDGTVDWTVNTAAAISSDPNYAGLNANDVSAATTDDDVAGFTLAQSGGTTQVAESGSSDTFTVVLNAVPTGNVVLTVTSARAGEATASPATLTFTPANWNVTQTVTITGVDDQVDDGAQTANVTVAINAALTADAYDGVSSQTVAASVSDDDTAAFTLVQSGGSTVVGEPSGSDSITLVLGSKPVSNVVLSVSSSDLTEATVSSATVTFTPSNWNVAQTVTINAADDSLVDGNQSSTITISVIDASSSDEYDAVANQAFTATTTDNDAAGITLTATGGSTSVAESGSNDTFTLVLTAQPASNVVLRILSADTGEVTAAPGWITFTPANWNAPQTVTLTGVDDAIIDGAQATSVTVSVNDSNSSNEFDPVADQVVAATTTDDDSPGVTVLEPGGSGDSISVSENGTTDSFTVRLTLQPLGTVVITITSNATGEATVSPARLFFGPGNFSVARTVTVRGIDELTLDGPKSFTLTVAVDAALSSNEYDGLASSTKVGTNLDNDVEEIFQYKSHATNWDKDDTMEVPLPKAVGSELLDAVMEVIRVNVTNNMSGSVLLLTEVLTSLPTGIPDPPTAATVSTMWNITLFENATAEPIANASLRLWVPNSWISANCPPASCAVRVFHYKNGSWETLVPTIASTNATGITYQVVTTSFSPFVVGGITVAATGGGGGGGGFIASPTPPAPPVVPPAVVRPAPPDVAPPPVPPELPHVTLPLIPQEWDWSYLFVLVFGASVFVGGGALATRYDLTGRGWRAGRRGARHAWQGLSLAVRRGIVHGGGLYASMLDRTHELWVMRSRSGRAAGAAPAPRRQMIAKARRPDWMLSRLRRTRREGRQEDRLADLAREEANELTSRVEARPTATPRTAARSLAAAREKRPGAAPKDATSLAWAATKQALHVSKLLQTVRRSREVDGATSRIISKDHLVEARRLAVMFSRLHEQRAVRPPVPGRSASRAPVVSQPRVRVRRPTASRKPPAKRVPARGAEPWSDPGREIDVVRPRGALRPPVDEPAARRPTAPAGVPRIPKARKTVKSGTKASRARPPRGSTGSALAPAGRVEVFRPAGHGLKRVRPSTGREARRRKDD